jgi:hypothetical protein
MRPSIEQETKPKIRLNNYKKQGRKIQEQEKTQKNKRR